MQLLTRTGQMPYDGIMYGVHTACNFRSFFGARRICRSGTYFSTWRRFSVTKFAQSTIRLLRLRMTNRSS